VFGGCWTVYTHRNDKYQYHKIDGPAIKHLDGKCEWYFNGVEYKPKDHPFNVFRKEYNLSKSYRKWPNNMKILFKLTYGGNI
jgi:hypothetical protein